MVTAFKINSINPNTAIRAKLIESLWLKGNRVHSSHLDFVRGRQATVVMRVSELLEDSTLALGYAIADRTATTPSTTSAELGHPRRGAIGKC